MNTSAPVALVTGSARRIGAQIVQTLHQQGCNVVVHYHHSSTEADSLIQQLNAQRSGSAVALQANLLEQNTYATLVEQAAAQWSRLDILINNASSFYPTAIGNITDESWHDLVGTNLKAPMFLAQAAAPYLRQRHGNIINIVDTDSGRRRPDHAVYGAAKAGLATLTQILAKDLAPEIRANGVAPGVILWPENEVPDDDKNLDDIPLQRIGKPENIASLVAYLALENDYITGQIIAVDGGRSL